MTLTRLNGFSTRFLPAVPTASIRFRADEASSTALVVDQASIDTGLRVDLLRHHPQIESFNQVLRKIGDKASDAFLDSLKQYAGHCYIPSIRFHAADSIIGMANRGLPKAVEVYTNDLINQVSRPTLNPRNYAEDTEIRQLAIRAFFDEELQEQLASQAVPGQFWDQEQQHPKTYFDRAQENIFSFALPPEAVEESPELWPELALRTVFRAQHGAYPPLLRSLLMGISGDLLNNQPQLIDTSTRNLVLALSGARKPWDEALKKLSVAPERGKSQQSDERLNWLLLANSDKIARHADSDPAFNQALQQSLVSGLAKPRIGFIKTSFSMTPYPVVGELESRELTENALRYTALAKLQGHPAAVGFEQFAFKYLKPLAIESTEFFGLKELLRLRSQLFANQVLNPMDEMLMMVGGLPRDPQEPQSPQTPQNIDHQLSWTLKFIQSRRTGQWNSAIDRLINGSYEAYRSSAELSGEARMLMQPGLSLSHLGTTQMLIKLAEGIAVHGSDDTVGELASCVNETPNWTAFGGINDEMIGLQLSLVTATIPALINRLERPDPVSGKTAQQHETLKALLKWVDEPPTRLLSKIIKPGWPEKIADTEQQLLNLIKSALLNVRPEAVTDSPKLRNQLTTLQQALCGSPSAVSA